MYHYRPDIDGLRAVAVIPVLLFHAGMNYFSGGYIGVDIFFVVSGYLITSIIVVELEKEKFTILGFYERRVRRIFPALFTVIFFSIIVSQFLMLPNEYKDFGQSVFATTFFLSNVLFWIEAGYFDAESLMKPLLHTWSLAVEEQYYIFYPPLLILIYKLFNKKGFPLIAGLWVASLAWSVWST
ncbi:MAG: acyltransferase, partial [Candidatus Thiodiazotropha sp.]